MAIGVGAGFSSPFLVAVALLVSAAALLAARGKSGAGNAQSPEQAPVV